MSESCWWKREARKQVESGYILRCKVYGGGGEGSCLESKAASKPLLGLTCLLLGYFILLTAFLSLFLFTL